MRRTVEFDEFGPWVFEVRSPEDVPRLYKGHPLDLDTAEMVLKVPRRIWRRDANPDMDLYDHLLIAGPESLTVLSRRGDRYETVDVPYRRVAAVMSSVSLLDGRLLVRDVAGEDAGLVVNVRYNSVSHDLLQRLVQVISVKSREAMGSADPATPPHVEHPPIALRDLGDDDVALVTGLRELALLEDRVVPVATHQRTGVRRKSGSLRGVVDVIRPVTLHAAIVGVSPGELHVVHRRDWFSIGRRPVHSVAHTVLPVANVTGVEVADSPRYTVARVLRVTSGKSVVEIPFPAGAETGAAMLGALGASSDR
jgi:hypothetical protein